MINKTQMSEEREETKQDHSGACEAHADITFVLHFTKQLK